MRIFLDTCKNETVNKFFHIDYSKRFIFFCMMSTVPEQPKKKRRIDVQQNVESHISLSKLSQTPENSVDHTRSTYLRTRSRGSVPGGSYNKASKLLKKSPVKDDCKKSKVAGVSFTFSPSNDSDDSSQSQNFGYLKKIMTGSKHETSCNRISVKAQQNKCSKTRCSLLKPECSKQNINYLNPTSKFLLSSLDTKKSVKPIAVNCDIPETSGFVTPKKIFDNDIAEVPAKETLKENSIFLNTCDEIDDKKENLIYFQCLPPHILENILCQIPFTDLMKNALVCKAWYDIIMNENFMEWKKRYYGLKKNIEKDVLYMEKICTELKVDAVEKCFGALLVFMFHYYNKLPSSNMYNLLMKNPKAVHAELVLSERFPELSKKETKVWCIFTTVILMSVSVNDICNLYGSLMTTTSDYSCHDITNAFYCVASFLFYFKINFGINYGLHYRVYNALYWIENNCVSKEDKCLQITKELPSHQNIQPLCQILQKPNFTNEQLKILKHKLQPGHIVKIIALAGTGKTTTLIHLAQQHPQMKFLNIMFNKNVCEEAMKGFPPNVTCKTAHSIAYEACGIPLKNKFSSKIRAHDLIPVLEHHLGSPWVVRSYARYVRITLENFISSPDNRILMHHVPIKFGETKLEAFVDNIRSKILRDANQIWLKMIDQENKSVKMTYDAYLKQYHLSRPKFCDYDCLMIDEAQDCNHAMLDIIISQHLPVILAGDSNQQMYGFNGAKNAFESLTSTHIYHLAKSFRFGPKIAYVASCCLEVLKSNNSTTIVGSNKSSFINGRVIGQYAIITRTKVELFKEAYRLCVQRRFKSFEPRNVRGCFPGGFQDYGFDELLEISRMVRKFSDGNDPSIDKENLQELSNYARSIEDLNLLAMSELVYQHGSDIETYVNIIKESCCYDLAHANVVFTTAYKSKGLEFDTVCLTDDYPIEFDIDFKKRRLRPSEEHSIIYVAVTRAKQSLILSKKLINVCLAAQEKFEYPVRSSVFLRNHISLIRCAGCIREFEPSTVLISFRRKMILSCDRVINSGPLCTKCATRTYFRPILSENSPVVIFIGPVSDYAHLSMSALIGFLPSNPEIAPDTDSTESMQDVIIAL
ncbi:f-box DNA helicase 1 [Caerostris darwini]|uniref:F-box DNA helicase 1 n=1 Tax=Caerostris darwini TaxID=1538125 RepID=A0AAV4N972_9ARAC|nr:f-box DNA helicase 1 [Caerostris darwini]